MTARAFWSIAAKASVLVAPAGLNFVVPSTTAWIYESRFDAPISGYQLRGFGQRIPLDKEGLARHQTLLLLVDQIWRRQKVPTLRLPVLREPLPAMKGFDTRKFVRRSAALLAALEFEPSYASHPSAASSYAFEMAVNGVTFFSVDVTR